MLINILFIFADNGLDSSVLQASSDVYPGRYATAAKGGTLRQAAHDLQCGMEHVQAFHS